MNDFLKLCEGELGALLVKIKNRWDRLMSSLSPHSLPRREKGNLLSQLTESKPSPRVFTGLFWFPQIISSRAGRQRLSEAWTSSPHVAHEGCGSGEWSWAAALGMRSSGRRQPVLSSGLTRDELPASGIAAVPSFFRLGRAMTVS